MIEVAHKSYLLYKSELVKAKTGSFYREEINIAKFVCPVNLFEFEKQFAMSLINDDMKRDLRVKFNVYSLNDQVAISKLWRPDPDWSDWKISLVDPNGTEWKYTLSIESSINL